MTDLIIAIPGFLALAAGVAVGIYRRHERLTREREGLPFDETPTQRWTLVVAYLLLGIAILALVGVVARQALLIQRAPPPGRLSNHQDGYNAPIDSRLEAVSAQDSESRTSRGPGRFGDRGVSAFDSLQSSARPTVRSSLLPAEQKRAGVSPDRS